GKLPSFCFFTTFRQYVEWYKANALQHENAIKALQQYNYMLSKEKNWVQIERYSSKHLNDFHPELASGEKVPSELLCPICMELFVKPVSPPCIHTFCERCLIKRDQKTCPLCNQEFSEWRVNPL